MRDLPHQKLKLNAPAVIPEGFPEWEQTMNAWGSSLVDTATTVAEMAALGFGLERGAFSSKSSGAALASSYWFGFETVNGGRAAPEKEGP